MRKLQLFVAFASFAVLGLALPVGCGSASGDTVDLGDAGKVTLTVSPASAEKRVGETQAFQAIAVGSDGSDANVNAYVSWSSSDPAIATIDAASGVATAVSPGTVTIRAQKGNIAATATLTVVAATIADAGADAAPDPAVDSGADAATTMRLFVADYGGEGAPASIRVFANDAGGDTAPLRSIVGPNTTFTAPSQMAIVGNELFVADGNKQVLVFAVDADGDVAPLRSIKGAQAGFTNFSPTGILAHGTDLFVADQQKGLLVFPQSGSGDIAPTRTIDFADAKHIAASANANEILVAAKIDVRGYSDTASGGATPLRSLVPSHPYARGITSTSSKIYVTTVGPNTSATADDAVLVFDANAANNASPVREIAGTTNTGLAEPYGIAVSSGEIFVANQSEGAVRVFDEAASGDVAPKRTLKGASTTLAFPSGVLVAPAP